MEKVWIYQHSGHFDEWEQRASLSHTDGTCYKTSSNLEGYEVDIFEEHYSMVKYSPLQLWRGK